MTHEEIFRLISAERFRQDELKAMGKFAFTCADPMPPTEKLTVLVEEVGEVARAVLEKTKGPNLKTELVQVAAVCLAWLESL